MRKLQLDSSSLSFLRMTEKNNNCHINNVKIRSGYNGAGFAGIIHNNVSGVSNIAKFIDCTVDVTFDCFGIMGDGAEGVTLEGYEGKYTVWYDTWYYAESAKYFNEYNAPQIREDMDAIVHNTPYNMGMTQ